MNDVRRPNFKARQGNRGTLSDTHIIRPRVPSNPPNNRDSQLRADDELKNLRQATLNRAKRSPVKHRSVGLQSPIQFKRPKEEVLSDLKITSIRYGKTITREVKSIRKSPVKLASLLLIGIIILPFALKLAAGDKSSQKDIQSAQTTIITPVVPSKSDIVTDSTILRNPENGSATFQDVYIGAPLTVSQQALPSDFATQPDRLKQVAASIGAAQEFETRFGKAYLATTDGENAVGQRLAFATDDLLIFITSASKFSQAQWAEYINNLQ
ncbi:MAG: hypothetical protein M3Q70_03495 [bacterium]|nr:hypothetical protein [bacterium]